MPLYTFYPTRPDGLCASFVSHELADDAEAVREAGRVMRQHESAAQVVVYRGPSKILSVDGWANETGRAPGA